MADNIACNLQAVLPELSQFAPKKEAAFLSALRSNRKDISLTVDIEDDGTLKCVEQLGEVEAPVVALCLPNSAPIIIPQRFLHNECVGRFKLYQIKFICRDSRIPQELQHQLERGYVGVTRRSVYCRMREHFDLTLQKTGFALHTAWRAVMENDWLVQTQLAICAHAETLPEIYDMEERIVEELTLLPKGLNMIPGGYAGIRMLHQLGLTNNKKLSPEQREDILTIMERNGHAGPCAHYRRGHLRHLLNEKVTWVRACFVALNARSVDVQL